VPLTELHPRIATLHAPAPRIAPVALPC